MSVELLIQNKTTGASELVPVATSQVFRDFWKTGSVALNLRHVLLLEDCLFERKDIPDLIQELEQLKSWFEESQSGASRDALVVRANNVIGASKRVLNNPDLTVG